MPLRFRRSETHALTIARLFQTVTVAEVTEELRKAYETGVMEPGIDRLLISEPDARLHLLDLSALQQAQQIALSYECRDGRAATFRTAMVVRGPEHRGIASLHKAVWDRLDLPGVRHSVFDDTAEALDWLGLPAEAVVLPD